jgi:hemerythrin-like metal-binding protein
MLWDSSFETGVSEVDSQNFGLVRHVEAMLSNDTNRARFEKLSEFERVVEECFDREQRIHASCGYSKAEEHKFSHRSYLLRLRRMKERFIENGPTLENEMMFIKDVVESLKKHIALHDMDFAAYYLEYADAESV